MLRGRRDWSPTISVNSPCFSQNVGFSKPLGIIVFGIGIACAIIGSEIIQHVFFKGLKGFSGAR